MTPAHPPDDAGGWVTATRRNVMNTRKKLMCLPRRCSPPRCWLRQRWRSAPCRGQPIRRSSVKAMASRGSIRSIRASTSTRTASISAPTRTRTFGRSCGAVMVPRANGSHRTNALHRRSLGLDVPRPLRPRSRKAEATKKLRVESIKHQDARRHGSARGRNRVAGPRAGRDVTEPGRRPFRCRTMRAVQLGQLRFTKRATTSTETASTSAPRRIPIFARCCSATSTAASSSTHAVRSSIESRGQAESGASRFAKRARIACAVLSGCSSTVAWPAPATSVNAVAPGNPAA